MLPIGSLGPDDDDNDKKPARDVMELSEKQI
jgi:hypothetical protein